ncbi:hypothetical protein JVT61DRAFT_1411 [Boletus reticuloceps]|uniref:Uncharacterized protein n=1 Tax=Boletus reticuloceps TaxID=495285 RepID=A0A8I2YC26_9AGAM|nr:hypothetical protein JVT61DRAFT_1411 [Boletus reticuloceps]
MCSYEALTVLVGQRSRGTNQASLSLGRHAECRIKGSVSMLIPYFSRPIVRLEYQLRNALKLVIGKSLRERMVALCERFISSGNYNEIYNMLFAVELIEADIQKLPPSKGHSEDSETLPYKVTCTIIRVLEDLLLNAMEGTKVSELEHKGLLLYQAVPDALLD